MEKLMEEIKNDFDITPRNIEEKIYSPPNLHAKYLKKYFIAKTKLNKLESELSILYKNKYEYYTFDYHKKLENAKEISFHINSDPEFNTANVIVNNQKLLVDILDRTLKKAMYLTQDIKIIIDYTKYLNGC